MAVMAVPPAYAVAVALAGDMDATAFWAMRFSAPSDILKALDAGLLIGEAAENGDQVHSVSPYEPNVIVHLSQVKPITWYSGKEYP